MSWQDIIKEFRTKSKEGWGAAAVLVLMYLAFGEDWPYNMVKQFKANLSEKTGWKTDQLNHFKKLRDTSLMYPLLINMEKRDLLLSRSTDGRHYFELNPKILLFRGPTSGYCKWHKGEAEIKWGENLTIIYPFLNALKTRDRLAYFNRWSNIELFDLITFYQFLMQEANELKMNEMAKILKKNIDSIKMDVSRQAQSEAIKKSRALDKMRQIE